MTRDKTILIAHRQATVRDRFAAALADARHAYVVAASDAAAREAVGNRGAPISLALVDLGLAEDGPAFVHALRAQAGGGLPIVVFAGTVESTDEIRALAAMNVGGYINEHAATPQILPALAPHLFPDSFNRRHSARVALSVPISYRTDLTIASALTLDLGKGGVAIRTMSPVSPDTRVHVKFQLPGEAGEIEAWGRVAWSDRRNGMGIQFERVDAGAQAAIDRYVEAHS
jgi:uncharacterized protein (TIGR02266 family)